MRTLVAYIKEGRFKVIGTWRHGKKAKSIKAVLHLGRNTVGFVCRVQIKLSVCKKQLTNLPAVDEKVRGKYSKRKVICQSKDTSDVKSLV